MRLGWGHLRPRHHCRFCGRCLALVFWAEGWGPSTYNWGAACYLLSRMNVDEPRSNGWFRRLEKSLSIPLIARCIWHHLTQISSFVGWVFGMLRSPLAQPLDHWPAFTTGCVCGKCSKSSIASDHTVQRCCYLAPTRLGGDPRHDRSPGHQVTRWWLMLRGCMT